MQYFLKIYYLDNYILTPISIGIVSEYKKHFYAEFNNFKPYKCKDQWIIDNVIPKLGSFELGGNTFPTEKESNKSIITRLTEYFKDCRDDKADNFWSNNDSDYQWVLFCRIFGGKDKIPEFSFKKIMYSPNGEDKVVGHALEDAKSQFTSKSGLRYQDHHNTPPRGDNDLHEDLGDWHPFDLHVPGRDIDIAGQPIDETVQARIGGVNQDHLIGEPVALDGGGPTIADNLNNIYDAPEARNVIEGLTQGLNTPARADELMNPHFRPGENWLTSQPPNDTVRPFPLTVNNQAPNAEWQVVQLPGNINECLNALDNDNGNEGGIYPTGLANLDVNPAIPPDIIAGLTTGP